MAAVMAGCGVVAVLALWFVVRPKSVERLTP
jgi:DHA1 family bicyclomycin/chloramphenicol resistance-like MFS transporter